MDAISFGIKMLRHSKEMQEFRIACQVILPIMSDPKVPRDEKRSTFNMMINELSDKAFKLQPIVEQIMGIINMKEEVCREYPDSEAQVEGILSWLPRFKDHRDMLLDKVKQCREGCGLKN